MKSIIILVLLCIVSTTFAQNTSYYEGPQYFPERPYDGIIGEVDSMVTYTFEVPKLHYDSVKNIIPPLGKCVEVSRQYYDANGRRTLLEELKMNDKGLLSIAFREATERDDESRPRSRTITQNGITDRYILQSKTDSSELYKTARQKGGIPSIATQKKMTVTYEVEWNEFDLGGVDVETEFSTIVTTTVYDPSGLQDITIDVYDLEGNLGSTQIVKKDGAGSIIYDSYSANDSEEGLVSYGSMMQEDERGNYKVLATYNKYDILQKIDIIQLFYRETVDEGEDGDKVMIDSFFN